MKIVSLLIGASSGIMLAFCVENSDGTEGGAFGCW